MVKIIKFFLFDDLKYRVNYTSEGIDKKISSAILNLFLSYFVKSIRTGILYKKIEDKYIMLRVDYEEDENEYVIKFVYIDALIDYPIKMMYENGFIDSDFKHADYPNLEFDTLSKYMKSIDASGFRQIVSALFSAKYYDSAIRLRGNIKELLLWIAAIQTIFTKELAEGISFKIENYKNDIGMASISISGNIIDIRDRFTIDNKIEVNKIYKFTSILERHYLVPSSNLEAFLLFTTHFDYKNLDERFEDIYNIYMISRLGIGDIDYSTVKLSFDTLEDIGTKEAKRIVILNMLKGIDKLTTEMDIKFFKLILGFAFRASNEMESLFINEMCKDLYVKSLVSLLFGGRYKDIAQLEQAIEEVESISDKRALYKYILDDKRLEHIDIYQNIDFTPERVQFMLKNILKYNIELGYKWNNLTEKASGIITKSIIGLIKEDLDYEEFFYVISQDEEYLSNILIGIFEKLENEYIQESFMKQVTKFLIHLEDLEAISIRKRLALNENGIRFLYEEFKENMAGADYDIEAFITYMPSFHASKEYYNKCFSRAVAYMLSNADENKSYKLSMFIINQINDKLIKLSALPDKTLKDIVLSIEQNVDFENCEEVYEILDILVFIKKDRNIRTSINIVRLLQLQKTIADGGKVDPMEYESPDMRPCRLTEVSYNKYKSINIDKIVGMCTDKEEHKAIADVFMKDDDFIFDYMKLSLNDDNIHTQVSVSFIIYYLYYVHPVYKMSGKEDILMELRNMIIERICELNFTTICIINDKVKVEFEEEHLSMPVEWEEIFVTIKKIKSEGNFVNKIKFMMKK